MATLRSAIHLHPGLFSHRLQIRPRRDPNIDPEGDGGLAVDILYYRVCWSRIHEASETVELEWLVHGTQPVPDHHQWNTSGAVH